MKNNKLVIGILAHVDAGKTTLSECILFLQKAIGSMGRVDKKDAFLDTDELERERGITILSKQALFTLNDIEVTLLDTPGHVDFTAETERTLQVIDYGLLVISGADGIQGHTLTLWRLLKRYGIPVFIFINKMDQEGTNQSKLMAELSRRLDGGCIDFTHTNLCNNITVKEEEFLENIATCDEALMENYLSGKDITQEEIAEVIARRQVFPCYFGSALQAKGVKELLEGMGKYIRLPAYQQEFGARVYKISRDNQGNRLTHMKITGGSLKVKEVWGEKIDQIRLYNGEKYTVLREAQVGSICAVTGMRNSYSGQGLGIEKDVMHPLHEPVMTYGLKLPEGCDTHGFFEKMKQLEEENPQLKVVWEEQTETIHVKVMGEVEKEVLQRRIKERFGADITFDCGSIIYKETIAEAVIGMGHFEPLRHYAEVHLLIEPAQAGSGIELESRCSEDKLDGNIQRLVLSHLSERIHPGVLTGSEVTDVRITLTAGKAHPKHTEGGDFRQAAFRALRQGLKRGRSILLEPVYEFRLEIPMEAAGRAMSDIQRMYGSFKPPQIEGETSIITGCAPAATIGDYQKEVIAYTKGYGKLFLAFKGYEPCHNEDEIIAAKGYDSEKDVQNPTGSIFCAHGAGFTVNWNQVEEYIHVESGIELKQEEDGQSKGQASYKNKENTKQDGVLTLAGEKELEEIFVRTYGPIKRELNHFTTVSNKTLENRGKTADEAAEKYRKQQKTEKKDEYLLVDGYNIIFAWKDLQELSDINIDSARYKLLDLLCDYQAVKGNTLIVVFDAYKVAGNTGSVNKYHNIHVVYTKEAETADQYIEKTVHEIGRKHNVTVATSDALEQMIVWGDGANRLSAGGLKEEMKLVLKEHKEKYIQNSESGKNYPFRNISMEDNAKHSER